MVSVQNQTISQWDKMYIYEGVSEDVSEGVSVDVSDDMNEGVRLGMS